MRAVFNFNKFLSREGQNEGKVPLRCTVTCEGLGSPHLCTGPVYFQYKSRASVLGLEKIFQYDRVILGRVFLSLDNLSDNLSDKLSDKLSQNGKRHFG